MSENEKDGYLVRSVDRRPLDGVSWLIAEIFLPAWRDMRMVILIRWLHRASISVCLDDGGTMERLQS
jgi:hypothetical protein